MGLALIRAYGVCKARIGGHIIVVIEASLVSSNTQFLRVQLAHVERRSDTAQVDPIKQCNGAAIDVNEFRYAIPNRRANTVAVRHL